MRLTDASAIEPHISAKAGKAMSVDRTIRSPNYSSRKGRPITMLVLHATAGSARSALAWLTNATARVSAHYLIDKSGHIYQLVGDEFAAWHAGNAHWKGETAINELSIGIELENANNGRDLYPSAQIAALLELSHEKVAQYHIAPDMVVRHKDIAVPRGRKSDPAGFPWAEFLAQLFPQAPTPPPERAPRPNRSGITNSALAQALRAEAYHQVGAIDRPGWAMTQLARTEALGLPIGPSFDVASGGRNYIAQSFGKDTLASPIGEWHQVVRLSTLVTPEQRPLREALLQAVYAQADETYHPDWATHQYALRNPIGPPIGSGFRVTVAGKQFVAASYAMDTIYSPVDHWQQIGRLSDLIQRQSDTLERELAQTLQERLYQRVGVQLRADWPLYQYALQHQLGAPLGPSFRVSIDGNDYVAEAYALDVVYCKVGEWKEIARLSALS